MNDKFDDSLTMKLLAKPVVIIIIFWGAFLVWPAHGMDQPLVINAKSSEPSVTITLVEDALNLGQSVVAGWPFDLPKCRNCDLTVQRRYYPNGPDTVISLLANDRQAGSKVRWVLLESWQKMFNVIEWHIQVQRSNLVLQSKTQNLELKRGSQGYLDGCLIRVLWLAPVLTDRAELKDHVSDKLASPQISDDGPRYRTQLLIECD